MSTQTVRLDTKTLAKLDAIAGGMGAMGKSRSATVRVLADGCPTGSAALLRLLEAQADEAARDGGA